MYAIGLYQITLTKTCATCKPCYHPPGLNFINWHEKTPTIK